MTHLIQQLKAFLHRVAKRPRDRVLARLRAHTALAVSDGLREIALRITAERVALSAELTERMTAELASVRRQLDDVSVCNDGLLREVVRLQREVRRLLDAMERSSSESSPISRPFGDTPHIKLGDQLQSRAA